MRSRIVGIALISFLIPSISQAIEVQMGNRAQSMGMAFTAVADDPSAVVHNPAGLAQIKGTEIDVGANMTIIDLTYTDTVDHPTDEIGVLPTFFVSTDVVDPVVLGFGLYVPWGSKAEVNSDPASGFQYMKSELARFDATFAVGYQLTETIAVGGGFTLGYLRVKNDIPLAAGSALRLEESADGFGFSGVAGMLWKPHPRFKAGLNYRAPMNVKVSGDATFAGTDDEFSAHIRFPGTLSLGLAIIPIDELTVSVDFDWTNWTYFNEIERDYETLANTTQPLNGGSAHDYRIGFEYRPWEKTNFRWGYSYQEAGWPESTIVPSQLEYPMHVMAVGMSQKFWKMRVDLGYELSLATKRDVNNNLSGYNGQYDGTRQVVMTNFAFQF